MAASPPVHIVGAGPGDPELLTLRGARALRAADVVLYDRLVSPAILREWTRPEALLIPVGKQCRHGASTPQEDINNLMVHHALLGRRVVRLKGGDISLLAQLAEELQALLLRGISYVLVPGITAASGAAAAAGIPLTAKGLSTSVRFLAGHAPEQYPGDYWRELAHARDTLVFYMSGDTLAEVARRLMEAGASPSLPLALIQQATTPHQRVRTGTLSDSASLLRSAIKGRPTLIILGEVAALHDTYAWLAEGPAGDYFPPVPAAPLPLEARA